MKATKEVILKLEISGEDLESFKSALEKVILAESGSHLGIGILKEDEQKIFQSILKVIKE